MDKDAEEKKALAEMAQFSQDLGLYEDFSGDDTSIPIIENSIQLSPEAQMRLFELVLNPPEFNDALVKAKENYERLFGKKDES